MTALPDAPLPRSHPHEPRTTADAHAHALAHEHATLLVEPCDETGQHRAHTRRQMFELLRVETRPDVVGEEQVGCGSNFSALASALYEALTLLACPAAIRALCQEKDGVRRGAEHVIGDASVSPRDPFRELVGQGGHLDRDVIRVQLLMRKRT